MHNQRSSLFIIMALFSSLLYCSGLYSQDITIDEDGFETFTYDDGDSIYILKKYYICFLKSGPKKSESPEEGMALQKAHLDHMSQLANEGKICIAGPFANDTELRGIVIYSAQSIEEAQTYADTDPMVKAGILIAEIHQWWAAKGSKLY